MISKITFALLTTNVVNAQELFLTEDSEFADMPWLDKTKSPEERAELVLAAMTWNEKASFTRFGFQGDYNGHSLAIDRLKIPQVNQVDGTNGYVTKTDELKGTTTQFPSSLTTAASFDPDTVYQQNAAIGTEYYNKGAQIMLGPALNVNRVDRGGRNAEYLSGEDPYLGYILAQSAVKGLQDQNVMGNAKHYALNNQEADRMHIDEHADERTRFEMYYPPFEGAIEANVGSIMCSYNKINGIQSCENNGTLNTDLRERLGYKGYVLSDWGATHSMALEQG